MTLRNLILVASLLGAAPAVAASPPKTPASDPRIRTVDYDPQQVMRIVGVHRTATQVLFGSDETIQHVALGDTSSWEVAAEGSILFIKPTSLRAPTNLLVTTATSTGETRNYVFELSARSGSSARTAPGTTFVLRVRHPQQDQARLVGALAAETRALEQRLLTLKLERGAIEGTRNLSYALQGSRAIAPSEVSDNGRFTVLRFPGAQAIPGLFVVTPDGSEALAPFDVRGEFVVVHQTAPQLRLRRGREVLCIHNLAWSPRGPRLTTGTAAPQVDRILKEQRR
ncbi:type IV secretory pathway, VirB9 component [Phenylobacterium zucineum HLK1]|uniref:Type IV secretory pathway, VirB9 component n=1 Tax=Phenylobacterium zucineum (strain HLK1) TaxID=450851 RepID=B4RFV1_PHEZH|nr:TrbG/VirB9 family P-type conjugative transfer protein [Phenylobacterium zucineum]ACG78764.1 type IV secretory pathway, VirB9 component [Phenylobacterium zucineum HLK1]